MNARDQRISVRGRESAALRSVRGGRRTGGGGFRRELPEKGWKELKMINPEEERKRRDVDKHASPVMGAEREKGD